MCGFAGCIVSDEDPVGAIRTASAMAEELRHRGPDDEGVWEDAAAGYAVAFRRLSIIDLSASGHQPMVSADGRFSIVFNGEIYNHRELRERLATADSGIQFRGTSDTEVLLATIQRWGLQKAVKETVGMFAIALWDRGQVEDESVYWSAFDVASQQR